MCFGLTCVPGFEVPPSTFSDIASSASSDSAISLINQPLSPSLDCFKCSDE
jgi:hypothetical protein